MSTGYTASTLTAMLPVVDDIVEDLVGGAVGWGFSQVAEGIAGWVLEAVGFFVGGVVDFLMTSASPTVTAEWFIGADSPFQTVRNIAVLLLLAFLFLGLIQGLMAGDVGGMVRRVAMDLPAAVIGMASVTVIVDQLLVLTDALSAAVLSNSDGQAIDFLSGFGVTVSGLTNGFAAVLLGLVAIVAGLVVWIELMVRSVLVYLIVALSPLAFATTVWPAAKGVLRRTIELLLAVIVSKLVIAVALALSVSGLAGAGTAAPPDGSLGDDVAMQMGTLLAGTAILGLAAFAPFLILKLIPIAEAAVLAQGMSRAPVRGAQATMSNIYYGQSLSRLAGGSGPRPSGSQAGASAAGGSGVGLASAAGPAVAAVATKELATATTDQVKRKVESGTAQADAAAPPADRRSRKDRS